MALFQSIRLVKAGRAGTVLPAEFKDISAERFRLYSEEIGKKMMFCVIGESMSPEGIHTDNILIADEIKVDDDANNRLKEGDFIILRIPKHEECTTEAKSVDLLDASQLKVRKFITILNLDESYDSIWEKVKNNDKLSKIEEAEKIFKLKYEQAISRIPKEDKLEVLLSITYTAKYGREYSFHTRKMLYARVVSYIDNNNNLIDLFNTNTNDL